MLTPDELLHISEGAEEIAEALHQDILDRIIERIMIRLGRGDPYILTAVDKWQIQTLQDAGYLLEDIQREIAKRTPYLQREIADAMEDAGVKAINYDNSVYEAAGLSALPLDQSPALIRIMQRNYEATLGELVNFTGTMAQAAQQAYIQACDKAYNQVLSGSLSYTQAVREAVMELAGNGVTVTYPSGHTDSIETAVRRAVRTGVSQASGQITDARMIEMDWDIVLTSAHVGARPGDGGPNGTNHIWWQGRFFSRTGRSKQFPDFEKSTGYKTVTGLCGANCRHSFGPGDGVNNPFDTKDINFADQRKAYEQQQRQNTLERRIRNTKREVMGLDTARQNAEGDLKDILEADYQRKAALLQKQNKAYIDFCEESGLKRRSDRISVAQWDRKQAAQARAAAKKYGTDFTAQKNSATIKLVSGARITDQFGDAATEHAERYYGLVRSMTTDVSRIAKITGYSESDIQKIKDYVFIEKHNLGDGEPRRFDPSFAMAQSWQRLIDGHPEPHDMTLIQHEVMERRLVESGMAQDEAHIMTTKKYNYSRVSDDYYAALKEYKNREK